MELPISALRSISDAQSKELQNAFGTKTIGDFLSTDLFSGLLHFFELKLKLDLIRDKKKYVKVYSKKEQKDIYVCIDENLTEEELVSRLVALSNSVTTG